MSATDDLRSALVCGVCGQVAPGAGSTLVPHWSDGRRCTSRIAVLRVARVRHDGHTSRVYAADGQVTTTKHPDWWAWEVQDAVTGRFRAGGPGGYAEHVRWACELAREDLPVQVRLADGSAVTVRAGMAGRLAGVDGERNLVFRETFSNGADMLWPATPCCQASGKGSSVPSGVVCRSCYAEGDGYFGGPAEIAVGLA